EGPGGETPPELATVDGCATSCRFKVPMFGKETMGSSRCFCFAEEMSQSRDLDSWCRRDLADPIETLSPGLERACVREHLARLHRPERLVRACDRGRRLYLELRAAA